MGKYLTTKSFKEQLKKQIQQYIEHSGVSEIGYHPYRNVNGLTIYPLNARDYEYVTKQISKAQDYYDTWINTYDKEKSNYIKQKLKNQLDKYMNEFYDKITDLDINYDTTLQQFIRDTAKKQIASDIQISDEKFKSEVEGKYE